MNQKTFNPIFVRSAQITHLRQVKFGQRDQGFKDYWIFRIKNSLKYPATVVGIPSFSKGVEVVQEIYLICLADRICYNCKG